MSIELLDYFVEKMGAVYGSTYFLSRHLYEQWYVEKLSSKHEIDAFLSSHLVRGAIIPNDINLIKRYDKSELDVMGVELVEKDRDRHEFVDKKNGYSWRQVYHGVGEIWLDKYQVIFPSVDDTRIVKSMKDKKNR